MNFGFVPSPDWDDVRALLMPAIDRMGEYTEAQVREELQSGEAQLWMGRDEIVRCAVVTKIRGSRSGPVCEIWLMGGRERALWMHFLAVIEAAAIERGCIAMELTGRAGWERLLPDYRRSAIVLRKALPDG